MNNDDIRTVAKYIRLNHTPIIIKDRIEWVPVDQILKEKKRVPEFLNEWTHAFKQKDRNLYLACYKDESSVNAPLWDAWKLLHKKRENDTRLFDLHLKNLSLFRQSNAVIAMFDEMVTFPDNTLLTGTKKLYLVKNDNHWKIIGEAWQSPTKNDLAAALEKFDPGRHAIAKLVKGWIKAWSEKDLERYISYYASDFKFRRMNRNAWKRYKGRLNKLYGPITITFQDFQIKSDHDKRVVAFRQNYSASKSNLSDGYKAIGIKRLFLKRVGKDWKIYHETWERL